MWRDCTKITLGEKKSIFQNKQFTDTVCSFYVNIAIVQILGQSNKFSFKVLASSKTIYLREQH